MKTIATKVLVLLAMAIITSALPAPAWAKDIAFTQEELTQFLSEKTYPLGKAGEGAFYFHADGTLDALWKGKMETSTWTTNDNSEFCYELKMFGGRECIQLKKKGDKKIVHIYYGKKRVLKRSQIVEGKTF
jgi:hypothetical protein